MLWHHFRDTVELEDLHEYGYQSMFAQVERGAMVSIVTMIHDVSWMCHGCVMDVSCFSVLFVHHASKPFRIAHP